MENINSFLLSLTAIVMSLCGLIVAIKKTKKEIETALPKKIKKQCSIERFQLLYKWKKNLWWNIFK